MAVLSVFEWCIASKCCAEVEVVGDKGSTTIDINPNEGGSKSADLGNKLDYIFGKGTGNK